MPRLPLVIKGRIWCDGALRRGAIGIDPDGRIAEVADDLDGDEVIDHGDHWVLPGGIDIHVHFRDPGHPHKEDFGSGTRSALVGGTTTVFDMPNTDPATTDLAAYRAKFADVATKAHTDWGLYGGATRPGPALRELAAEAPGIKLYLGESTGCVTLEDPEMLPDVLADLSAADFRGVLAIHAEARDTLVEAGAAHREAPGLEGHAKRRPVAGEAAAIAQVRAALEAHGATRFRIHIAHLSSPALLNDIPLGTSIGVTPNHLYLDQTLPLGARGRMNPPLRTPEERRRLFAALVAGRIPVVESDHAPHAVDEKDQDVRTAPSGIPGVGTLRPLLLASVVADRLPLHVAMRTTAETPATLFGLMKGRLAPGYDADLAVHDPAALAPIAAARLQSRAGWTPFEGREGLFPHSVYLRGMQVVADGAVTARPGIGRPVVEAPR